MKIHFLSFASKTFYQSLHRIEEEANASGFFDTVTCIKAGQLPFKYRFKNFLYLNRFTRGYGYWMWKSFITKAKLEQIDDGDVLVYVDAGCKINREGKSRFEEYVQMLVNSEYSNFGFQTVHTERKYTKGDLFKYFGIESNEALINSDQLLAGVFLLKKDMQSVALIDEWYSVCHKSKFLINDSKSKFPNSIDFVDHRHDQSVFSILRKIRGGVFISDETYFSDWGNNLKFPFHTKRLRR